MKCLCQDSERKVCGKEMTTEEYEQDGMCDACASEVWYELIAKTPYHWTHPKEVSCSTP